MADENQVLVIDGQDEELERWIAFMDVTYTEDAVGAVKGSFPKWLWTRIGKFWDGHPKLQRNPQVYGYGQSFTFRAHADVMLFVGYINGGGLPLRWTIVDSRTGRITTYP